MAATPAERHAILTRVLGDPPRVHPGAPNGTAWRTGRACYEFLADSVADGSRTLETGAGLSTVLFAAWGCRHTSVVPFPDEAVAIERYCTEQGIDTSCLTFDLRPSELALPALMASGPLDLVFIDGAHSFPLPVIDWFYGAGRLRSGGIVVFDDVPLPAVGRFLDTYLDLDPRWERVAGTRKWRAYRRLAEGSLSEHESNQGFYRQPRQPLARRALGRLRATFRTTERPAADTARP
jgi:predicted O-methyltransferase YrrM